MAVYLTGDTHGTYTRFSSKVFTEQKFLSYDDFIIVLGDFGGVWGDTREERYWLDWLNKKPFTTCFIDGNHENFHRLNSEFEEVDFHGAKAHKIREHIYHLERGYIYDFCGKTFFCFGGAQSHDIEDGVLKEEDFKNRTALWRAYRKKTEEGLHVRVNRMTWWEEEMPTAEEMAFGEDTLLKAGNKVDFILTHCCPYSVSLRLNKNWGIDPLTKFFDNLYGKIDFGQWYFGHYHVNYGGEFFETSNFTPLFTKIQRVV